MIEPRLASGLALVWIVFKKLGDTFEYHAKRAPYGLHIDSYLNKLNKKLMPSGHMNPLFKFKLQLAKRKLGL